MRACSIGARLPVDRLRPLEDLIRELAQLLVLPVFQHERRQEDRSHEPYDDASYDQARPSVVQQLNEGRQ